MTVAVSNVFAQPINGEIGRSLRMKVFNHLAAFWANGVIANVRFPYFNLFCHTASILLLASSLCAQTQGNAIQLIDSFVSSANNPALNCGSIGNCVQYPESLNVGDVIVVGAGQENATCGGGVGVTNPPWTVSDTLGNTFTNQTAYTSGGGNGHIQLTCMQVTTGGTDQITVSGINHANGCANSIAYLRFKNASCNVDGAPVNSTSTSSTGTSATSTSITTTVNGDVLVSVGMQNMGTQSEAVVDGTTAEYGAFSAPGNGFGNTLLEYKPTGNLGTYSMGMASCCNIAAGVQVFMQTIALKPAVTIGLTDTVLPDAASGVAYAAQLHCIGGILAPTYSLFSGSFPSGISLNTSTGAITGTTSTVGSSSLQFKCTDGTSTSAAQPLTLKVGAAFNPIIVKSATTFDGDQQPGFQTVTVSCGDFIVVMPSGADTHHGIGWMPATSGVGSGWTDTFGNPVQRLITNSGYSNSPLVAYIFGPSIASGTDQISYRNNGGGSAGLPPVILLDISGTQAVIDPGTINNTSTGSSSIAQSITTLVPNELALVASIYGDANTTSMSFASPFALISATGNPGSDGFAGFRGYGSDLVSSASTVTATTNVTGSSSNSASTLLMALRPGLPTSCQFIGAGEKKRRAMN